MTTPARGKKSRGGGPGEAHPGARGGAPEPVSVAVDVDEGKPCARVASVCETVEWPSEVERARYLEKVEVSAAAEERRRTGRYLAVCLTLVMLFIACYHILMRQMPVLVGILAPAIIMILYVLWLLYFAKKRKRTEITLV